MNSNADKDPQVFLFITGLVYSKLGDDTPVEEVQREIDKLYGKFQEDVFDLAYNQLDPAKQEELKSLVDAGGDQEQIQKFVLDNIPDFQKQLSDFIAKFQEDYAGKLIEKKETKVPKDEIKEA